MLPSWLPAPRGTERYVRSQSNQKVNLGFSGGEFCIRPFGP